MNLASVADRLAAVDRRAVAFDPRRCLHTADRFAECAACQSVCPLGAIRPGAPPSLDAAACAGCFACLPACPTGAFTADDAAAPLLECAARVELRRLEVVCARHPAPERGLSPEHTAVQVRGCLAGLGVGALVALAALGVEEIVLRAEACAGCAWAGLSDRVRANAAQAQTLLAPSGRAHRLTVLAEGASPAVARPVFQADNPPLSRRDLFRLAARRGQVALARAINQGRPASAPQPPRERVRLTQALAALPSASGSDPATPLGPGFGSLHVSADCNACGVCPRACPTAALTFERTDPPAYRLLFRAADCLGCGACRRVCASASVTINAQPAFAAVFGASAPVELRAGPLVRCGGCHAWVATVDSRGLCAPCAARRARPLGLRSRPTTRESV
ncbi:MAG: 4Fe-4S dicluster domain-containing protein [Anaerolineales bacterium]|nr:4Fe-4S dicluster domain-containing protein [Anaerolineales bacterium]